MNEQCAIGLLHEPHWYWWSDAEARPMADGFRPHGANPPNLRRLWCEGIRAKCPMSNPHGEHWYSIRQSIGDNNYKARFWCPGLTPGR